MQWQRDASVISCSFDPHGGPVEGTSFSAYSSNCVDANDCWKDLEENGVLI